MNMKPKWNTHAATMAVHKMSHCAVTVCKRSKISVLTSGNAEHAVDWQVIFENHLHCQCDRTVRVPCTLLLQGLVSTMLAKN